MRVMPLLGLYFSKLTFYKIDHVFRFLRPLLLTWLLSLTLTAQATNPVIYADVPDLSMIRVGDTYYMSSTTIHMSPGVPIMKSEGLTNWKLISYAYDTLADTDELRLEERKNTYGRGSWASCLNYHDGTFYV